MHAVRETTQLREWAPYAAHTATSRGRQFGEPPPRFRGEYQRDRDRIVHSSAFRRLEYKTQVFVNHEGDLFRTRLTHSLEVAQIARSAARALRLNDDLAEAIALAHDLGHTPFGHAGQDALNACMQEHGGFEHNVQSLRIIDRLEVRYAAFDGLNLMFETRAGVLKHCAPALARQLGAVGERFLRGEQATLEAQLCNLADEIAYNNHDVDDGLRAGLLRLEDLQEVELFAEQWIGIRKAWPKLEERRLVHETVRAMIGALVEDLIIESARRLDMLRPDSLEAVYAAPPLIGFSAHMAAKNQALKRLLRQSLYAHPQVLAETGRGQHIITTLFAAYKESPQRLPEAHQDYVAQRGERAIADYIAGMTDRYAQKAYTVLTGVPTPSY